MDYQLSSRNGWKASDPDFGGWGYAMKPPKAGSGDPMAHSNLTSTCFAVGALCVIGQERAAKTAVNFVQRCQNPKDGGFFTTPSDPVLNKAGPGVSYGSATADGLRCLYLLGGTYRQVNSAKNWLVNHFSARVHPGAFLESRREDRDSLLFYYLWSLAHCIRLAERTGLVWPEQTRLLAAMREHVIGLQRDDGSFRNPVGATREDDPLVATPMALANFVPTCMLTSLLQATQMSLKAPGVCPIPSWRLLCGQRIPPTGPSATSPSRSIQISVFRNF